MHRSGRHFRGEAPKTGSEASLSSDKRLSLFPNEVMAGAEPILFDSVADSLPNEDDLEMGSDSESPDLSAAEDTCNQKGLTGMLQFEVSRLQVQQMI
jgi:hypothetical protein